MIKIPLIKCTNILLDSTIIINLFRDVHESNSDDVNESIIFTKQLINSISTSKSDNGDKRIFHISTVSVAEIFKIGKPEEKKEIQTEILKALDSENVEFISFDISVAKCHNEKFKKILDDKEIDKLQEEIKYENTGFVSIRERIRKDILIISSGIYRNVDLALTTDRGFHLLCQKLELNCLIAKNDNFNVSKSGIVFNSL